MSVWRLSLAGLVLLLGCDKPVASDEEPEAEAPRSGSMAIKVNKISPHDEVSRERLQRLLRLLRDSGYRDIRDIDVLQELMSQCTLQGGDELSTVWAWLSPWDPAYLSSPLFHFGWPRDVPDYPYPRLPIPPEALQLEK